MESFYGGDGEILSSRFAASHLANIVALLAPSALSMLLICSLLMLPFSATGGGRVRPSRGRSRSNLSPPIEKGLFWSLILTSAVFGGVHLINVFMGAGIGGVILQIGYSFLIGAMCSVVLLKTRNIWLCVLLHAIYDFSGTLMPTLGAGTWWDTPTVIFTAVLAVATTAYLVWQFFVLDLGRVGEIYKEQPLKREE